MSTLMSDKITIEKTNTGNMQLAQDFPGTSPEGPLKVVTSRIYREPSGNSQGINTKN